MVPAACDTFASDGLAFPRFLVTNTHLDLSLLQTCDQPPLPEGSSPADRSLETKIQMPSLLFAAELSVLLDPSCGWSWDIIDVFSKIGMPLFCQAAAMSQAAVRAGKLGDWHL